MADATAVTRDERGNWRPDYLKEMPAPWLWPPRPLGILRWFFGWPGYLWPWYAIYLGVAVLAWYFLTPPLAEMATFEAWWIALIFARNLGLAIFFFGGMHLYLYVFKAQGTDYRYSSRIEQPRGRSRLFGSQVRENVFWSLASGVTIWTAYEAVTWWLYANEIIPYLDFAENPAWFVILMVLIPLFRDVHFYLTHRLLHWKPLYRLAHYLHHRNINIGPWSGLSMHPIEHLIYFSGVVVHWVIATHPLHAMFHLVHMGLSPAGGHSGYDRFGTEGGRSLSIGLYMHYLHHQYFECNYGSDEMPIIDKLMGTYHDGSDEAHERMKRRLRERQWARSAAST